MKRLFIYLMGLMTVAAVSTSCSKDDEPVNDGLSIYLNAVEMLYNNEAKPKFTPSGTEGVYLAWAADEAEVRGFIVELTDNDKWTSTADYTVNADENGYFTVKGQTPQMKAEGIFNEIVVNFTDYTPFTLQIITEEKAKDYENSIPAQDGYSGSGVARLH